MIKNYEEAKRIATYFWNGLARPFAVGFAYASGIFVAAMVFVTVAPLFMRHLS